MLLTEPIRFHPKPTAGQNSFYPRSAGQSCSLDNKEFPDKEFAILLVSRPLQFVQYV